MIQKYLGLALKNLREKQSISQEKFALLIGMDRTYYSSVESGKRNISIQNISKIATGFQVPISYIFEIAEQLEMEDGMNASN